MQLYTVWENNLFGVKEKCLRDEYGNYIGQTTGKFYSRDNHYHSDQIKGKIVSVDDENLTGMYHLQPDWDETGEENSKSMKEKYVGCFVTLEKAHYANGLLIYRCLELNEYFSENEVEII